MRCSHLSAIRPEGRPGYVRRSRGTARVTNDDNGRIMPNGFDLRALTAIGRRSVMCEVGTYLGSQPVHGAPHAEPSTIEDVRVNHRRAHVPVPQEFLYCPDVIPILQEVRRKGMPKRVAAHPLRDPRPSHGLRHRALHRRLMQVKS